MALVLKVLSVCGALLLSWSLCPCIVIVVNHNQTVATPRNDVLQPPNCPPCPLLWLIVVLLVIAYDNDVAIVLRQSRGSTYHCRQHLPQLDRPSFHSPLSHNHLVLDRLCLRAWGGGGGVAGLILPGGLFWPLIFG
jgi:hypothetical protein